MRCPARRGGETRRAAKDIDATACQTAKPRGRSGGIEFMGERRLVHDLHRRHAATRPTGGLTGGPTADEALRRLVANRDRLAALMRAGQRAEPPEPTTGYRSSYAARLWALAEAAEPKPASRAPAHLTLVDLDEDF